MNKALYLLTCFFACQLFAMDKDRQSPAWKNADALKLVYDLCKLAEVFSIAKQELDGTVTPEEAAEQLRKLEKNRS